VHLVHLLASEGGAKNLWDPTILGILTVLAGVVLFCGSAYMLLATNMGARQGFLVAFAALTGLLMLLGMLWLTTNTPLNVPKGRVAEWQPVSDEPDKAVVEELAFSDIDAVRSIADAGDPVPIEAPEDADDVIERGELRPAVEGALVTENAAANEEAPEQPLAIYSEASEVVTELDSLQAFVVGGETKNLFWHEPRYAAIQFCTLFDLDPVFDDPNADVVDPECDPAEPTRWLILERDYGSLRLPAVFYTLVSGLLFGLTLYALHIKERADEAAAASGALTPANA